MIIVEGPDGTGKTHVVSTISRMFGLEITKFGGPPRDDEEGQERLRFIREELSDDALLDRCPPMSEFVYGHVLRGSTRPDVEHLIGSMIQLATRYPLVVFCHPLSVTGETIDRTTMKSWKPRELLDEVTRKYDRVVTRYYELYRVIRSMGFAITDWSTLGDPARLLHDVAEKVYEDTPRRWYPGPEAR